MIVSDIRRDGSAVLATIDIDGIKLECRAMPSDVLRSDRGRVEWIDVELEIWIANPSKKWALRPGDELLAETTRLLQPALHEALKGRMVNSYVG